jgi:hypothetical protein
MLDYLDTIFKVILIFQSKHGVNGLSKKERRKIIHDLIGFVRLFLAGEKLKRREKIMRMMQK